MPEWTGTVIAKSPNGIKAVDDGAWLNFTKDEWRGTPFDDCRAGDRVRIEYAEDDKGRTYINVIENLTPRASVRETRTLEDSPFPAEEEFPLPDDDGYDPPGSPAAAPGAPPGGGESDTDRQTSIVRQTCIKAAAMALQYDTTEKGEAKAALITNLAGVLEDWCWR